MEASGVWNQRYDEIDDIERARRLPSPQLVGTPEHATLDLNVLKAAGVEIVGRLATIRDGRALFSGGLANQFALADLKMNRLLGAFDDWARSQASAVQAGPPERFEPTRAPPSPRLSLDLRSGEIRSIVWATGFRPDYRWLDVPVLDRKGELRHDGGVVREAPGMYAMGLPVLRRRKSTFIVGAEDDARDVVGHLARYLADRFNKKNTTALFYAVLSASVLLLGLAREPGAVWAFAAVFGFSMGADYVLIPLVTAECFGTASLGKLLALIIMGYSLGQWGAPWITGRIFETQGNYDLAWKLVGAAGLMGAATIYAISPRQTKLGLVE